MNPTRREVLGGFGAAAVALVLPSPVSAERRAGKRILVLGAGMSGLVAAEELLRLGHDVTVLEATLRAGGRVHTVREPFSEGLFAEAGAGRIPSTHGLTLGYARRFGLQLTPYRPRALSEVCWMAGERFVVAPGRSLPLSRTRLDLTEAERQLDLEGLYRRYTGRFTRSVGQVPPEAWPTGAPPELFGRTIGQLLRENGASEAAVAVLTSGFADDSALDFLRDAYSHEAPLLSHVVGGNDRLPFALARRLGERILYGAPVVRVEQDSERVRLTVDSLRGSLILDADRAIVTAPLPPLRQVEFRPSLSPEKAEAIASLPYGAVTRVFLQMRRRYWRDARLNGFATLDEPMEVWDASHDQPGHRGVLLAYLYEDLARRVAAMSPPDRIAFFLERAEQLFPGAREHIEGGASFSWHEQPYQRGAFSVCSTDTHLHWMPRLAAAEGRLHFAGEHTSPWPGWIQGAIHSGLRAAREVHRSA